MKRLTVFCAFILLSFPAEGTAQVKPAYSHGPYTAKNVIILSYGKAPVGSGVLHTWRKITGLQDGLVHKDFWITWLGDGQELPPISATCDITYHLGDANTADTPTLAKPWGHDRLIDNFWCKPI